MDENNLFDKAEEVKEAAAEEVKEFAENAEEKASDAFENVADAAEDAAEDLNDAKENLFEKADEALNELEDTAENALENVPEGFEEAVDGLAEEVKKKSKAGIIAAIILIVVVLALGAYLIYGALGGSNKYNKMGYADVSGMTLGEMCEQIGVELDEFKTQYQLPEDMPEDTYFNAAYNMMPASVIAGMNMTDFATIKEEFKIPDTTTPTEPKGFINKIKAIFVKDEPVEITEDTPWGIVQDEITLEYCVGEENMEEFKNLYGFGDEVTLETKWKEVRPTLEKYAIDERLKAEQEEAEGTEEIPSDEEAPEEAVSETEAPEEAATGTEAPAEEVPEEAAE